MEKSINKKPIGVFDSGLGGLTAVKELQKILPGEDIVYLGDTGRVPYGTRGKETIERYAMEDAQFLLGHDVKMIVAACGTVSSTAVNLKSKLSVPFVEVVSPAAIKAATTTKTNKIGVLGTAATIKSGAFDKTIKEHNKDAEVFSVKCPLFVSLVENGWFKEDDELAILTAKRYLTPIMDKGIDVLILGCTHFPLLSKVIAKVMGENITLINTGAEAAKTASEILQNKGLLNASTNEGISSYYVTDTTEGFETSASIFLGKNTRGSVEQINLEMEINIGGR